MRTINIAGIQTEIDEKNIEIGKISLDMENPRIAFFKDAQPRELLTQEEITFAIVNKNPQAFNKLKESIESNHGVLYPIWVVSLGSDKFRVIEGNTRLVIYRDLSEKYLNDPQYKKIPCWVLPQTINEDQMNFLRLEAHLRGVTEWDTYEKARYLYRLNDKEGYSVKLLERLTKMTADEIKTSIQAFKYMEMQYLPKYGKDPSEVFKFSYFVEYEKNTKLKNMMKRNNQGISDFCDWVGEGKIPRAQDVRDLPEILEQEGVRETFVKKGYDAAMEKLEVIKPDKTSRLFRNIERVIDDLMELTNLEINEMKDGIQPGRIELINRLYTVLRQTKNLIEGK